MEKQNQWHEWCGRTKNLVEPALFLNIEFVKDGYQITKYNVPI
jgi:hypothetical protein